jgi:hypothetical protein
MCLLSAVGLQLLVVLIGTAVAAALGNEYHMLDTAARLFCWPVFFLSLVTAIVMTIKHALHCCLMMGKGHCGRKGADESEDDSAGSCCK